MKRRHEEDGVGRLTKERLARFGWDLDKDEIVFVYVPEDDEEQTQEPAPTAPPGPQGR